MEVWAASLSAQSLLCRQCGLRREGVRSVPSTARSTLWRPPCRGARLAPLRAASLNTEGETPKQVKERRLRESQQVEERVQVIFSYDEFRQQLQQAGHQLVVLDVESSDTCDSGLGEEPELHWREDRVAALERCAGVKHVFQRTARDSPDVTFLTLEADTDEGQQACDQLGVKVLPTLQFWRDGAKLWEHRGIVELDQDLTEGVLYYRGSDQQVQELTSRADLDAFVNAARDERVLTVVAVTATGVRACVRVFPAVVALAKSFAGYAVFGRLLYDTSPDTGKLAAQLNVVEVPTFLFYREGRLVGRQVGASRADLIGQILAQQNAAGVAPPPPPKTAARPRRKMMRSV
ncbi:hypothetical protein WJX81_007291 [Elliptochloris bilobata]|uniref:Thioredoxin domain-containing protein n=1 Tax=Elliptochloris bilobata TaxID=381761 RepID=A0AAW1QLV3_9CHLO